MYVKHFLKMFIGLIGMAFLGAVGFALANYYSSSGQGQVQAPSSQAN
jgi:hypothetical protein